MSDWILWPVVIIVWVAIGVAVFFAIEIPALRSHDTGGRVTLSLAVWTLWEKFPLSILWLWANLFMFIGGLTVHLFWHWCPPGSISGG